MHVCALSPQTEVEGSWPVGQVMTLPAVPPCEFQLRGPPLLMIAQMGTLTVVCVMRVSGHTCE